ncbi:M24 family metallopeptidase [Halobacteria archaeon AArc-dxtr1]|nr:M24 family metallopeptidase [Halobacteria archaeon AArc-dxtr1]
MEKLDRLSAYLAARDLESVWFARPNSFAWLTGGSNVVDRSTDRGVGAVGYDGETVTLLTDTIEVDRLVEEELPDIAEFDVETFPWYASTLEETLAERVDGPAAADVEVPGWERVDPTPLRQPLTERDRERYRKLGEETATAVESVCRQLKPDDTEHEVASALRVAFSARGIEAPVILVGGSDRVSRHRHYTPKSVELGDYALISVTVERHGLHASCSRTVAFDPPEWLTERHRAAARVETTALAATQAAARPHTADVETDGGVEDRSGDGGGEPAGTAGDVFAAIQGGYDGVGWDGEWKHHHQGGAAGFAGREWIATPTLDAPVYAPMAYSWNPTVQGAKSEDTVLVTEDGFEVLTAVEGGTWPTIEAQAVTDGSESGADLDVDAVTLERPAVLELDG